MKAFGATVTLTSAQGSMEEAIDYAHNQVAKGTSCSINLQIPITTSLITGIPILKFGTIPKAVTHFVSSMGTTGTIMGNVFKDYPKPDRQ